MQSRSAAFLAADIALVVAAGSRGRTARDVVPVLVTVLALAVLTAVTAALRADGARWARRAVAWHNLDVAGAGPRPNYGDVATTSAPWVDWPARVVCAVTVAARLLGAARPTLTAGLAVALAVAAGPAGRATVRWCRARAAPAPASAVAALAAAVCDRAPVVVVYLGQPAQPAQPERRTPDRGAARVARWLTAAEQLELPVLVVARDALDFDIAARGKLPVVLLGRAGDVEAVVPATVRVALYPRVAPQNNHLIRLPGIVDVLLAGSAPDDSGGAVGPGEVAGPVTRLVRIFDQVWVSDLDVARRLTAPDIELPPAAIRLISAESSAAGSAAGSVGAHLLDAGPQALITPAGAMMQTAPPVEQGPGSPLRPAAGGRSSLESKVEVQAMPHRVGDDEPTASVDFSAAVDDLLDGGPDALPRAEPQSLPRAGAR